MSLIRLRHCQRKIASFVLLWLLFSGQLYCTAHAGFGVEPKVETGIEASVKVCCHGGGKTTSQPQLDTTCCDNPSSLCCGNAKHGTADPADTDFSNPILALVATSDQWFTPLLYNHYLLPLWAEDIYLQRSDPPIHLLNCTFLD